MYTWCTEHDWCDESFDLDWCTNYYGTFASAEEARHDAEKNGYKNVIVLEVD